MSVLVPCDACVVCVTGTLACHPVEPPRAGLPPECAYWTRVGELLELRYPGRSHDWFFGDFLPDVSDADIMKWADEDWDAIRAAELESWEWAIAHGCDD